MSDQLPSKKLNLVHRLRQNATSEDCLNDPDPSLLTEAATEIERLRGAIENYFNTTGKWKPERDGYGWRYTLHAALSGEPSPDETNWYCPECAARWELWHDQGCTVNQGRPNEYGGKPGNESPLKAGERP